MFDANLPGGRGAQVAFIIGIEEERLSRLAQLRGRTFMISSGKGSKKESGITIFPLATPMRGLRARFARSVRTSRSPRLVAVADHERVSRLQFRQILREIRFGVMYVYALHDYIMD